MNLATVTRVVSLTLAMALAQSGLAGGGGGGGGGGKGGNNGGGGGGGKGGNNGGSSPGSEHDEIVLSVKDRKTGKIDLLLTCKKPAPANYKKRVTIGSATDPSNKVSFGCVEFDDSLRIRNYDSSDN